MFKLTKTSCKLFGLVFLCCFLLVLGGYNRSKYPPEIILRHDDYVPSYLPAQLRSVQEAKNSDAIIKLTRTSVCRNGQANFANLIFLILVTLICFVGIFRLKRRLDIMVPVLCFSLLQTTSIFMELYFIELPFLSLDPYGCAYVILQIFSTSILFIILILPLRDYRNDHMSCPVKIMRSCWYVVLSVVPLFGLVMSWTISKLKLHPQLTGHFRDRRQEFRVYLSVEVAKPFQTVEPVQKKLFSVWLPKPLSIHFDIGPVAPFIGCAILWYIIVEIISRYIMVCDSNFHTILDFSGWIYGLAMLGSILYMIYRCPEGEIRDESLIGVSTMTI